MFSITKLVTFSVVVMTAVADYGLNYNNNQHQGPPTFSYISYYNKPSRAPVTTPSPSTPPPYSYVPPYNQYYYIPPPTTYTPAPPTSNPPSGTYGQPTYSYIPGSQGGYPQPSLPYYYYPNQPSAPPYFRNPYNILSPYTTYTVPHTPCDDHSCPPSQCCESNGVIKRCVNSTNGICVRLNRCDDNGDCPMNHCCVIRMDTPYIPPPPPTYGLYVRRVRSERGECVVARAVNETCRQPVDGVETSACPCMASLSCQYIMDNPQMGVCR